MKPINWVAVSTALLVTFALLNETAAQRKPKRPPTTVGDSQPAAKPPLKYTNSAQTPNEKKTYVVGASRLSREEQKRIREKWVTLAIPQGETERAKGIRARARDEQSRRIADWRG